MPRLPRKMRLGQSPFATEWNALVDWVTSLRPIAGPGTYTSHTPHGTAHQAGKPHGSGGTSGAQVSEKPKMHRFKSMTSDYLICRKWDGTNEGATDINIAKPPKLRQSITSETIDGTDVDYTYSSATVQTRTATPDGGAAESQVIVPRYLVNDLIFAVIPDYTGVTDVTLMDDNEDARAWAKVTPPPA